jgi:murein hydrolase activator
MVNLKFVTIFFLLYSVLIFSQELDISARKDELNLLRSEIKELETEINQKSRTEKQTFESLEQMRRQVFIINKMINTLRSEEAEKEKEIKKTSGEINLLELKIASLKNNYAKSVTGLYKYGNPSGIELLLNSESINQALLRREYLKRFSDKRKNDIEIIKSDLQKLSSLKLKLEVEKNEKDILAKEKLGEEGRLRDKMSENNQLIASLKKDKKELKKEIDSRRKAEVKIKSIIEKLIAEAERKRKAEIERLAELEKKKLKGEKPIETASANFDLNTAGLSAFSVLKGKLNWPVLNGRITGPFGESRNQQLKTVTLNYGVDIKAGKDLNVKSVADGIVSAIDWIPGYGSVIIVTHAEDYRTVYSRLSEIYVTEGEKVSSGKLIAKVGTSLEGNILHFEIWNSRNYQNPEIWLSRK